MKFMTWNVRCQNKTDDARGCGWAVRRPTLCAILNEQAPDIVATQEAYAPQIDDIGAALPAYQMAGVGRDDGARAGEFAAIFFRTDRFELRGQSTRWLSSTPDVPSFGPDAGCVRVVTVARLFDRETNRAFEVWNSHFDNRSARARLEGAQQIRRGIEALDAPAIVCGDLNCVFDDEPIRALTEGAVLRDARLHSRAEPSGPHATFCGFADYTDAIEAPVGGDRARIDYVLPTRDWQIESYAVLPTDDGPMPASDHRPIVVELT